MFNNKNILILGFARSGYEAAKILLARNNKVVINDKSDINDQDQEKIKELKDLGCEFVFSSHPMELVNSHVDYLIKNPGIKPNHPYVVKANELGIEVINEMELAYRLLPKDITLISITGTNGKTTTTTLIYEIIKKSGRRVHLTGNIGYPLCSFLKDIKSGDIIVTETSCQQLVNLNRFHPNIAVITNLSEAHIDFLDTYDNYKKTKARVYQNMTNTDLLVLNYCNEDVMKLTKNVHNIHKEYFSINENTLCYYRDNKIYYDKEIVLDTTKAILEGNHNYENMMASIIVTKRLDIDSKIIKDVLYHFMGVEHRLEFVMEVNKRKFYNDSKATNIKSTQIALSSFKNPIMLILGGMERHQDFHLLDNYMKNVKLIVCYGENKSRIMEFGRDLGIKTLSCDYLKEAVHLCYNHSCSNDIILLSPASASWDQYKCFEDRGIEFKKVVSEING